MDTIGKLNELEAREAEAWQAYIMADSSSKKKKYEEWSLVDTALHKIRPQRPPVRRTPNLCDTITSDG